jgi:hypothetical protein
MSLEPGYVDFYFSSVVRDSPSEWRVTAVGTGRFTTESMDGTRVATLWDASSGFPDLILGARSPVQIEGALFVFLYTSDNRHLLARVPIGAVGEIDAYAYWDGHEFSPQPKDAVSVWGEPAGPLPRHNGLSVRYNDSLGKWLAIYASDLTSIRARVADAITGPWGDEVELLDCREFFPSAWPTCYSPEQHPELSKDHDSVISLTVASRQPYEVWLLEVELPAKIP